MLQNLSHFLTQSYHPLFHFLIFVILYQVVSYDCVRQKSFWLPKVVKASLQVLCPYETHLLMILMY